MKYGVLVGAQKESYNYTTASIDNGSVVNVKIPSYKNSSDGYHFGISEESNHFITKMYYYHNSYSLKNYNEYETRLKQKGFVTTLGFKMWWLQPFVGFKTYNVKYSIDNDRLKENYSIVSFGADFEIPLSSNLRVYTGYSTSKKDEIDTQNDNLEKKKSHHDIKFGLRWNFGAVKAVSAPSSDKAE